MTIDELEEKHISAADKARAEAHRRLDEFLDELAAKQKLQFEVLRRHVEEEALH